MKKLLFFLLLPCFLFSQESKLKKAKDELKGASNTITSSSSYDTITYSSSSNPSRTESHISSFFLVLPYVSICALLGDMHKTAFNTYPYNNGLGEYLDYNYNEESNNKRSNVKLAVNYMPDRYNGLDFNVIYKPTPIVSLDVSYTRFFEKTVGSSELLATTSLMFNYNRFRTESLSLWWGLGFDYALADVYKIGRAYQVGADLYIKKPVSIHVSYKLSSFANAQFTRLKGHLKFHYTNKVFFIGYNSYTIGTQTISNPCVGFEVFF